MLAAAELDNPITWALLIGWIMTVVLHEWAHGFVAYLGGDYTIKERGGLSLNPLQYVDPVMSLILPAIFLMMGGIPLPGGVTYVRRELLRSRGWQSAVAAAGPAMNFLLFLLLSLPFHQRVGLIDATMPAGDYKTWHIFLGALAQLQIIAALLNLIPIPPLDGFNIISPYLDEETRTKVTTPPIPLFSLVVLFLVLSNVPAVHDAMFYVKNRILVLLGFNYEARDMIRQCFNFAVAGRND
jgi:Zn-dependent protease